MHALNAKPNRPTDPSARPVALYSVQRGDEQEEDLQKASWPREQSDRVRVLARAAVGSLSVSVYSLQKVREHRDLDGRLRAELPVDRLDAPATNRGCNQVQNRPVTLGP